MNLSMMYPEGLFSEDDLKQIAGEIRKYGTAFDAKAVPLEPQMAVEELIAPIMLFFTSDDGKAICFNVAIAGVYDVMKSSVLCIWKQLSGKVITKRFARGATTTHPVSLDLMVTINDGSTARIKLEGDIPVELQEKCLTQAIELVRQTDFGRHHGEHVVIYDRQASKFGICPQNEFIEEYLMKGCQLDGANS